MKKESGETEEDLENSKHKLLNGETTLETTKLNHLLKHLNLKF
jgi:hypothetical protein